MYDKNFRPFCTIHPAAMPSACTLKGGYYCEREAIGKISIDYAHSVYRVKPYNKTEKYVVYMHEKTLGVCKHELAQGFDSPVRSLSVLLESRGVAACGLISWGRHEHATYARPVVVGASRPLLAFYYNTTMSLNIRNIVYIKYLI